MGTFQTSLSPQEFRGRIGTADCPLVFDVRRSDVYAEAKDTIPTAGWRDHRTADVWVRNLPRCDVVVYCVHGHQVSQSAAALLRSVGVQAYFLEGGIEAYRAAGGLTFDKTALPIFREDAPSRWVTRERPKIDRIACPWFIRRFVDREAAIYFVAPEGLEETASELDAIPFDIPDVEFSHVSDLCSFDAFLRKFGVREPALEQLATIVRGADTGRLDLAPECAGLLAASLGLSAICGDDREMLELGMTIYDALYGWCRHAAGESHGWPPVQAERPSREGANQ